MTRVRTMLQNQSQLFAIARTKLDNIEARSGGANDFVTMCLQQLRFGTRDRVLRQPHDRIE